MGEVGLEIHEGVALITVSSPEVRNGMTAAMGQQFVEVCEAVDANAAVGAAIVRGDGGTFCSGADTRTWDAMKDPASPEAFAQTSAVYGAFERVGQLKVPTLAAVRGSAVGAGMNLLMATDLRVVANDARLMAGFIRIGIHPGGGFFTLSSRLAGREATAALGLFSEEISGKRAVELGLAWESLDDADVEPRAHELARRAARDPELIRHALAIFRAEVGPPAVPWSVALEMERGIQMWSQRRRQMKITEGES